MKKYLMMALISLGIFVSSLFSGIVSVNAQTETPKAGAVFGTGSPEMSLEALSPGPAFANICVYDKWWCYFWVGGYWWYEGQTLTFPVVISDPNVVGVNWGIEDEPLEKIDVTLTLDETGYGRSDTFYFTGLTSGYAVMTACAKEHPEICLNNPPVYDFSINSLISLTLLSEDAEMNNNPDWAGGGLRIFPGKQSPDDTADRKTVKISVRSVQPGATVYFKSFDMDDAADSSPEDLNGTGTAGNDNRGTPKNGTLSASSVQTDESGFAEVEFTVTMHPGDNFMVAASCNEYYLNGIRVNGFKLIDADGVEIEPGNSKAQVTEMITVWRYLHIEVDSMGSVSGNQVTGTVKSINSNTQKNQSTVSVNGTLENNRFENGTLSVSGSKFKVIKNTNKAVIVQGIVPNLPQNTVFTLEDDDDFNQDGKSDEGYDIQELQETFSLMRHSDNRDENLFAEAFIKPKYDGGGDPDNNDNSIMFQLNTPASGNDVANQLSRGINSDKKESDDFWVAYVQLGYQSAVEYDNDPISDKPAICGWTVWDGPVEAKDSVTNASEVPLGGWGSLLFLETMRDYDNESLIEIKKRTAPHEVGHQFGLNGDDKKNQFGIMSEDGTDEFVPQHRNIMRWRQHSPGNPGN